MKQGAQQKKPARKGRLGAVIVLLILACLTCAGFLGYYVFQVESIEVKGNHLFSAEEIITLSGIQKGDNLFAISTQNVKSALAAQPFLTLVRLDRKWPSTIVLNISEKKAVAAVTFDRKYILIAEDGMALRIQNDAQDYLVVEGMGVTAAAVGAKIQGATEYQLYVLNLICTQITKSACKSSIVGINLRDPAAVTLKTGCGITIRIGTEENLDLKFAWIENLLPRKMEEGRTYGTLDVTGSNGASYIP